MFKFIFLLGICRASASSSAQSTQAVLSSIQEGLSQIAEDGSTRQIAINALMRSVKSSTQINSTQNATLEKVIVLILDVKQSLLNQTVVNQGTMDDYVKDLTDCNNEYDTAAYMHKFNLSQEIIDYKNEREDFYDAYVTYREKCDAVYSFLDDITTTAQDVEINEGEDGLSSSVNSVTLVTACQVAVQDVDHVVTWTDKLAKVKHWFADMKAIWDVEAAHCKTAESHYRNNESVATTAQTSVHQHMCYMRNMWNTLCTTRSECYAAKVDATVITDISGIGDKSQKLARMIDFVVCLVRKLQAEEADTARATCSSAPASTGPECSCILLKDLAGDYVNFSTTTPTAPAEVRCTETAGQWDYEDVFLEDFDDEYEHGETGSFTNGVADAAGVHSGPFGKWSSGLTSSYTASGYTTGFDIGHHFSNSEQASC